MSENIAFFKPQLDSISADIKQMQASLKHACVPFEIRYLCKTEASPGGFRGFEVYGYGPGVETTKYLVWNVYERNGNPSEWYLLYEEIQQTVQFEGTLDSYVHTGKLIDMVSKPLIECKATIRLEMYEFLEGFFAECTKRLELDGVIETRERLRNAIQKFSSLQF